MKNISVILACGLMFSSMSFAKAPKINLNFDVNNTILLGDISTEQGVFGALNTLLAKRFKFNWSQASGLVTYYDYQKTIKYPDVSAAQAKKMRVDLIRKFVEDHDGTFSGALRRDLAEMSEAVNHQVKRVTASGKEMIFFQSFFNLITYLEREKLEYNLVFRTFGLDGDDVSEIMGKELNTKFVKAKFVNNILFVLHDGINLESDEVKAIDQIVYSNKKIDGKLFEEVISNPHEIEKKITETPYIVIKDEHKPWNDSKESWLFGKMFFFSTENGLGEPILPIFFDDNAEDGIIRPVRLSNSQLANVEPFRLLNLQMFRADTELALMNPTYFIGKVQHALAIYEAFKPRPTAQPINFW